MPDSYALIDEQPPDVISTTDAYPPRSGLRGHRARAGLDLAETTGPSGSADAEEPEGDDPDRPAVVSSDGLPETNQVDPVNAASDAAGETSPPSLVDRMTEQTAARHAAPVISPGIRHVAPTDGDGLSATRDDGSLPDVAAAIPPEVGAVGGPSDAA